MKKFFYIAALAIAATLQLSSCSMDTKTLDIETPQETLQAMGSTYDISVAFDAPGVNETTLVFYDEDRVQISSAIVSVPAGQETVNTVFFSDSNPKYVYTPGLANANENGLLAIPASSVATKGGRSALLIVIRR